MKKIYLLIFPLLIASCNSKSSNDENGVDSLECANVEAPAVEEVEVEEEAVEEMEVEEEEANDILVPGETYYYTTDEYTDEYGSTNQLTVELTAYKDGSFSGQVIETVTLAHRPSEHNEHKYPIEGEWTETSRHDKRYMYVEFELTQSGQEFCIYIDEEHNVYLNDLSSKPGKIYKK